VTVRGAVSIARRLQDPLAELVKIDPRSLGIGQYQHDIDQKRLRQALHDTVESAVNRVGVELNTASVALLRYVAGLKESVAEAIVKRRENEGAFRTRQDLIKVTGVGPKTFEQAAGFLRIRDGEQPLDNTGVHPESYPVVSEIAGFIESDLDTLIRNPDKLTGFDRKAFSGAHQEVGGFTLGDILEELARPGRDPREKFVVPEFRDDVQTLDDLKPGMELEGTVTNVANFGAFVDVGVHQDGLVHVSELSTRFVQDPRDVVKVGDIVKVRVLSVDGERKRIALTMKPVNVEGGAPPHRQPRFEGGPPPRRFEPREPRFERGDRVERPRSMEQPMSTQPRAGATPPAGAPSGYVPGAWKRSGATSGSATGGSAKVKKSSASAPKAAPKTEAEEIPTEALDQIKALQERFNRNR